MTTRPSTISDRAALTQALSDLLDRAVHGNIATSASLYVGLGALRSRHIELHVGASDRALNVKTSPQSIYDLASLTKIIGTTLAFALAASEKKIDISEQPFASWPHATIRLLLAHRAGVPAHLHFYHLLDLVPRHFKRNYERVISETLNTPLGPPTAERVYSDLGFIALGHLLQDRLQKPLFEIFVDAWRRADVSQTFTWFSSLPPMYQTDDNTIVHTGYCPVRKNYVSGQVQDPNCYFIGGLAGHAGMFGNLASVSSMGHWFLRAYQNRSTSFERTIASFAKLRLGFDKSTSTGTTRSFSPNCFGHFGYTGTSLWIDPDAFSCGLVVSLLTNRVAKSCRPEGIYWLRLAINQLLAKHGAMLLE